MYLLRKYFIAPPFGIHLKQFDPLRRGSRPGQIFDMKSRILVLAGKLPEWYFEYGEISPGCPWADSRHEVDYGKDPSIRLSN